VLQHYSLRQVAFGKPENSGTSPSARSQAARLDVKRCAVGTRESSESRHPAGTTSKPGIWVLGTAEPQVRQKHFWCRVPGSVKEATASSPASQTSRADWENRFAAWADPVSFWQYRQ